MKRAAIYFLAGAVMDGLVTLYYIFVSGHAVFSASLFSALITVWSILFINGILNERNDTKRRLLLILSYALGNGVGTAAVMWMK